MLTVAVVADGTSDWVPVPRANRVWLTRRPLQAYGQPGETAGVGTSPLAAEVGPEALNLPLEQTSGLHSFVPQS